MAKKSSLEVMDEGVKDVKPLEDLTVEIKKKGNIRHTTPITFSGYYGSNGVPRLMQFKEDEPEFKKYGGRQYPLRVDDNGVVLDLTDPLQNRQYQIAKEMRDLGIHPFHPAESWVEIIEPEKEDNTFIERFDRRTKAIAILNELSDPDDMREFAHYFGLGVGKDNSVKRNMYEIADEDPARLIEAWEDPLRNAMVLTRKAIDKGLIGLRSDTNIYYYGEKVLGTTITEVASTLTKDAPLMAVLNSKI